MATQHGIVVAWPVTYTFKVALCVLIFREGGKGKEGGRGGEKASCVMAFLKVEVDRYVQSFYRMVEYEERIRSTEQLSQRTLQV